MTEAETIAPGWYAFTEGTVRRWDGAAWEGEKQPVGTSLNTPVGVCPYCQASMQGPATRCASCSGELKHCPECKTLVGMSSKQKFVGVLRGGMKTQYKCLRCRRTLDGPIF